MGLPAAGFSSGQAMTLMEQIAERASPPGIGYEWTGQSREEKLSGSTAPILLAFSLLAVFLCLAALYESWSIPFAVLLAVPLGVLGAVLGATMRGMPNDVFFKVGLITVIGLSAKNAILIIEFAKDLVAQGKDVIAATLQAVHLRFRPILMTSIAFILGVLPLVVSTIALSIILKESVKDFYSAEAQIFPTLLPDTPITVAGIAVSQAQLGVLVVSLLVIVGLLLGRLFGWVWMDPVAGICGAVVIAAWSYGLIRDTGAILLDMNPDLNMGERMRAVLEVDGDRLTDLHLWRLGPGHLGAIVGVATTTPRGSDYYHRLLGRFSALSHVTVEVQRG